MLHRVGRVAARDLQTLLAQLGDRLLVVALDDLRPREDRLRFMFRARLSE